MYPLFETICVTNGRIQHLEWHELRYAKSYLLYYGKLTSQRLIEDLLIPDRYKKGIYKLRIGYNEVTKDAVFESYTFSDIKTLKLVEDNTIEYGLKFSDRKCLNELLMKRGRCDDILIVKNGMVTDSSICNIVFFDGQEWITPANPLLNAVSHFCDTVLKFGNFI